VKVTMIVLMCIVVIAYILHTWGTLIDIKNITQWEKERDKYVYYPEIYNKIDRIIKSFYYKVF
jgi:hypothetical protein